MTNCEEIKIRAMKVIWNLAAMDKVWKSNTLHWNEEESRPTRDTSFLPVFSMHVRHGPLGQWKTRKEYLLLNGPTED